jgi:hypothetical protein
MTQSSLTTHDTETHLSQHFTFGRGYAAMCLLISDLSALSDTMDIRTETRNYLAIRLDSSYMCDDYLERLLYSFTCSYDTIVQF